MSLVSVGLRSGCHPRHLHHLVGFALTVALVSAQSDVPFTDADATVLQHLGALDSRSLDWNGDGWEDMVTFFPGNNAEAPESPTWLKFWQAIPNGPPGTRPSYVDVTGTVCAQFLSSHTGKPRTDLFGDIYDLEVLDVDGDGDEDFIAARQPHEDKIYEMQGGVMVDVRKFAAGVDHTSEYYRDPDPPHDPWPSRWTTGVDSNDWFPGGAVDLVVMSYRCSHARVFRHNSHVGSGTGNPPGPVADFVLHGDLPDFDDETGNVTEATRPGWWPPPPNPLPQAWPFPGNGGRGIVLADLDWIGAPEIILVRTDDKHHVTCSGASGPVTEACLGAHVSQVAVFRGGVVTSLSLPPWEPWYKLLPHAYGQHKIFDMPGEGSPSLQVNVADLNGDGRLDLIVPVIDAPNGPMQWNPAIHVPLDRRTRIYLNRNGPFAGVVGRQFGPLGLPTHQPTTSLGPVAMDSCRLAGCSWAEPGDFNLDGHVDLMVTHHQENLFAGGLFDRYGILEDVGDRQWRGNGTGTSWTPWRDPAQGFAFADLRPVGYVPPHGMMPASGVVQDNTRYWRACDMDRDGDLDLIETNFYNPGEGGMSQLPPANPRIYWNQNR